MKEQWIEDLSTKMDGYEMDAPEISWSEVEAKVKANRRSHIIYIWQRRIAVAASLLIIIAATTSLFFNSKEQTLTGRKTAMTIETTSQPSMPANEKIAGKIVAAHNNGNHTIISSSKNPLEISKNLLEISENLLEVSERGINVSESVKEVSAESNGQTTKAKPANNEKKKTSLDYLEDFHYEKPRKAARLMASAYYGNGVNMGSASISAFDPNGIQHDATYVTSGDNCLLEAPEEEPTINANHHQPMRIGVSIKYALDNHWGVETGLTYSYLKSDITEEHRAYTINSKQKVGYVGIPIAASYQIANTKPFCFYIAAGTMLEIPVMAKSDETMISSGMATTSQERNLTKSALQLSLLGRLGAQLNITPSLGLYVEPGVNYYFDNGSSMETSYSDKPLNFNLNMGVRFTIK